MFHKKGISPVIAWVLILGFTIALGAIVTNWYLQQSKKTTESTLGTMEGEMECNEIRINVAFTQPQPTSGNCILKVSNTGMLKIDSIRINSIQKSYDKNPKEYRNYSSSDITDLCGAAYQKITVLPLIKKDKTLVACQNDRTYEKKIL